MTEEKYCKLLPTMLDKIERAIDTGDLDEAHAGYMRLRAATSERFNKARRKMDTLSDQVMPRLDAIRMSIALAGIARVEMLANLDEAKKGLQKLKEL